MTKAFNWRQVFHIMGLLLLTEAIFLFITSIISFLYREDDLVALLYSTVITGVAGSAGLVMGGSNSSKQMGTREGYLIVGVIWAVFSLFGMLPFVLSDQVTSISSAFFETISGFTTTGATALDNIDSLTHGLLFWRCLTQWIGGMGIVVLSLAVLPMMGGMQMYIAEVSGLTYEKLQPKLRETAQRLWGIYLILSIIECIMLRIAGMDWFDAVCHTMTSISSGGFSTKQASIAYWNLPALQYILIFFMFISGVNFTLIYRLIIQRDWKRILHDEELRTYIGIIIVVTTFVASGIIFSQQNYSLPLIEQDIRTALFHVVSVITTTGLSTYDYMLWPSIVWGTLFVLMFSGACAGSTSGGIKVIRTEIIVKNLKSEFNRLMHPKAILPVRINRRMVPEHIVMNVYAFATIYVICTFLSTGILMSIGLDIREAIGVSVSMLTNVGIAIGDYGPAGTFSQIPDLIKYFLSLLMIMGRLELFTVLLLFMPNFWRR